jgi:polar amino acid transport system substrate-binding protein
MQTFGRFALLAGVLAAGAMFTPANAGPLAQIFTEENKPLNFKSPNGKAFGAATEIVQEIQKRLGDTTPITFSEWATAYNATLKQPGSMLFATARTEEREKSFKWVGPLTVAKTYFYTRSKGTVSIKSIEDAKTLPKIGVPSKFYYTQFLTDNHFSNLVVFETPKAMMEAFKSGQIDVFTSQNLAISYLLVDCRVDSSAVKANYSFMPPKKHYLAFNLNTPDTVILQWQKALDDLKADGTIKKIFAKYTLGADVMP